MNETIPPSPSTCIELLQAMVAFDTVTPHASGRADAERALGEWLAAAVVNWGLSVKFLPVEGHAPNVLLTHEVSPDADWWLFDSHLDTVDVGGMTIDPFAAEARAGRLYGRGACDTKGTGAAMLWAAKEAITAGSLKGNVAILLSVGEEHAQLGARSFIKQDLPDLPWRPTGVIVGEPTQMQTVAASNGFVRIKVTTHGVAAHSSTPELGRNAIYDMTKVIQRLRDEHIAAITARHPLTGPGTCSINGIRGGVQHNIIPDECTIQIDQRLAPGEEADAAIASVRSILYTLGNEDDAFHTTLHDIESAPPFAPESYAFAERVIEKLSAGSVSSQLQGAPYTTNANHFAKAGLPCVVLGPGDIAQAHTVDEWIALDQLELGIRGYRTLMERT